MEADKENRLDTRDLKSIGITFNHAKKGIDNLCKCLKDTPDLAMEFKSRLIDYILGVQ